MQSRFSSVAHQAPALQTQGVKARRRSLDEEADAARRTLGRNARALRLAAGLTLEDLAGRGDLDVRLIQRVEGGKSNPTVATLVRLAVALDVDLAFLFSTKLAAKPSAEPDDAAATHPLGSLSDEGDDALVRDGRPGPGAAASVGTSDELLALRVRGLRVARDWSQAALAARAGLSESAVQTIEGSRKSPTLRTVEAIALALETPVHEILSPTPAPKTRARAGRR